MEYTFMVVLLLLQQAEKWGWPVQVCSFWTRHQLLNTFCLNRCFYVSIETLLESSMTSAFKGRLRLIFYQEKWLKWLCLKKLPEGYYWKRGICQSMFWRSQRISRNFWRRTRLLKSGSVCNARRVHKTQSSGYKKIGSLDTQMDREDVSKNNATMERLTASGPPSGKQQPTDRLEMFLGLGDAITRSHYRAPSGGSSRYLFARRSFHVVGHLRRDSLSSYLWDHLFLWTNRLHGDWGSFSDFSLFRLSCSSHRGRLLQKYLFFIGIGAPETDFWKA
jgi:hypothetical protein